ncbi:hypothetical protein GWK16_18555 [Roseomonas sp. JC162]|uniref:DUF4169 family protein n=1 Tax=Neoroseomonas marina TaxID=1232220 RepID=A0A848EH07_9PROT|nr:hypothetical protein [Neoroseomonas marina]NMJ43256.1 hypothetical protein [Neoroseomonas marina]
MARKPNYGQQRADVNRAKQAKKDAKLREREEAVARRKASGQADEPETEHLTDKPARD